MPYALEFNNVRFAYPGSREETLRGVDFTVGEGEKVALLGLNGAGKSTIMLHTDGLLTAASGKVRVDGIEVNKKTLKEVRRRVGMVFQNADDQLFSPTVYADVAFGPQMMGLSDDEVDRRVKSALSTIGASHLIDRRTTRLSGGERRMVAIATVLSMDPSILVLDEPTSYLDIRACETLTRLLIRLPHAMLLATHNLDLARRVCSRALLVESGKIIYDGPVESAIALLTDRSQPSPATYN